ncbi:hypothetical protein EUGRSUZ_K00724 [Eucalyptus grandis]|uniref:Uncharacterized protein n=2 Tax=Eucalyptus grandis TaxID=71139 RepID=A0ACC3IRQ0_EUCGR|nr:hypothetical protein EUGRSUZ_K00724 [Eucalyptus grandis]
MINLKKGMDKRMVLYKLMMARVRERKLYFLAWLQQSFPFALNASDVLYLKSLPSYHQHSRLVRSCCACMITI